MHTPLTLLDVLHLLVEHVLQKVGGLRIAVLVAHLPQLQQLVQIQLLE